MAVVVLDIDTPFPDPREADSDGFVAVGGQLSRRRVLEAYRRGIFPWPLPGAPLAWFSPDPRMVLDFDGLRVSRSLSRRIRTSGWHVTFDEDFPAVIRACATVFRADQPGTWITPQMVRTYTDLHAAGHAHSVEVREGDRIVGGLYGLAIGRVFCGESMFHVEADASKVAFVALARSLKVWGFEFLDCQVRTAHLESLGARTVPRGEFLARLSGAVEGVPEAPSKWTLPVTADELAERS